MFSTGKLPFTMADTRAGVLIHTQHRRHTEKCIIAFHRGRFIHADKRAPFINEACQLLHNRRVLPHIAAAPCTACKARINNYVHILKRAV